MLVQCGGMAFSVSGATSYVQWYLAYAATIGIASAFISTIWGTLDTHPGLISAHPFVYLSTYLRLVGVSVFALGTNVLLMPPAMATAASSPAAIHRMRFMSSLSERCGGDWGRLGR